MCRRKTRFRESKEFFNQQKEDLCKSKEFYMKECGNMGLEDNSISITYNMLLTLTVVLVGSAI